MYRILSKIVPVFPVIKLLIRRREKRHRLTSKLGKFAMTSMCLTPRSFKDTRDSLTSESRELLSIVFRPKSRLVTAKEPPEDFNLSSSRPRTEAKTDMSAGSLDVTTEPALTRVSLKQSKLLFTC